MDTKMKSALALLALTGACFFLAVEAGFTAEQMELMASLRKNCMEETGVDASIIDACTKGTFADDEKLKCYIKCTYQQMTVMDDDGVVDGDTLLTMLPEELQEPATPVVNKCKDARGGDACGNAFAFAKCMYEAAPDKFVMI